MSLFPHTLADISAGLQSKAFSAVDLARDVLARIDSENSKYNIFLATYQDVLDQAELADRRIASGETGPMLGVPLAMKDNILFKGETASAASKMLSRHLATYDAHVVTKLREAGAVFVGRTNMDEFAMGASTESSAYGVTRNPLDIERVPGGSSGGSAAAVCAKFVPIALGTDTGGSVRLPAAFCGVVGMYSTYGSVSRRGAIALTSSLDQICPIGNTVSDVEKVFEIISSHDPEDATSVPLTKRVCRRVFGDGKRVAGVPAACLNGGVLAPTGKAKEHFEGALKMLESNGYEIRTIDLPTMEHALAAYYIINPAELSTNLARYDGIRYGTREEGKDLWDTYEKTKGWGFGPEVQRRLLIGAYVLSAGYKDAYYGKATAVRAQITHEISSAFLDVDVICTPTGISGAFRLGEVLDVVSMYKMDIYTVVANLVGTPAISVPFGLDEHSMPIGFQMMAPQWGESIMFSAAKILHS